MALGCFFLDKGKPRIFRLARIPNGLLKTRKMEVKIKNNEEMIDATIEVIGGVMVVSPVNAKFKPKEGDILSCVYEGRYEGTFILEDVSECGEAYYHAGLTAKGKFLKGNGSGYFGYIEYCRIATDKEKKKLFIKLAEEGFEWDAKERKLVKLKWEPKKGEFYYKPRLDYCRFVASRIQWLDTDVDDVYYKKGWVFKEKTDCENFCLKLNEAINSVKP